MPHRGGRKGRDDVSAKNAHLSVERLADIVGGLRTSSESATKRLFRLAPQQPAVAEQSLAPSARPQAARREKPDGPVPTVPAPAAKSASTELTAVPAPVVEPAVVKPAVEPVPAISMQAASKRGRHRAPASPRLVVRGFGLTSFRIALMGALALLVVAAAVLLVLS